MSLNDNYYTLDNKEFKNAFFIKPYNFNTTLENDTLNKQYNKVKKILSINRIITVKQEHTDIIKVINKDNINDIDTVADGMITNLPNVGLGIKVADCQAIFLYDRVNKVIGNIHSGWRGTIKKIVFNAIKIMINDFNCDIKNIEVYILPSIGGCHFEVKEDVYKEFKNSFNDIDIDNYITYKSDIDRYYIDTKKINKTYLISLGIRKDNIYISDLCSVCMGDTIHSYRYDKENSGRNLSVISL